MLGTIHAVVIMIDLMRSTLPLEPDKVDPLDPGSPTRTLTGIEQVNTYLFRKEIELLRHVVFAGLGRRPVRTPRPEKGK
jgi:hypothetical protein